MPQLPKSVTRLVESFERLPGVGPKSAQRLVMYLLHTPETYLQQFATQLTSLKKETIFCSQCHYLADQDPCPICADISRDKTQLCVVEQPLDVIALEKSGKYQGLYHVLHGAISPLNNIGPDELYLTDIKDRLDNVTELILATNPTMEGEATAMYITEYLKQAAQKSGSNWFPQLKITRIGHGLPIGADIEYADSLTLERALAGRQSVSF